MQKNHLNLVWRLIATFSVVYTYFWGFGIQKYDERPHPNVAFDLTLMLFGFPLLAVEFHFAFLALAFWWVETAGNCLMKDAILTPCFKFDKNPNFSQLSSSLSAMLNLGIRHAFQVSDNFWAKITSDNSDIGIQLVFLQKGEGASARVRKSTWSILKRILTASKCNFG